MRQRFGRLAAALGTAAVLIAPAQAETIDEIVAWVNGDIITLSDYQEEEQARVAELYRQLAGEELDQKLNEVRQTLLLQLIENKILVQRANMMYDMSKMREGMYEDFKRREGIEDEEDLKRMLASQGMTVDGLKDRLVEMLAPDYVIQFEVTGRVAVGDREVEDFYTANRDAFMIPGEVTVSEIVLLADSEVAKQQRRSEMEELRARILAGEDFAAIARDHSESGTSQNGGLLAPAKKGDLSARLEQVAFSLSEGELSDILEFPYGLHLLKVEARSEDRIQPLEEIRERLRKQLEDRRFFTEYRAFMDKARSEADWCVKPGYRDRLPIESPECQAL